MYLITYAIFCILNSVMIRKFTDLSLGDWEMWLWFTVPFIAYLAGVEAGGRSKG